MPAHCLYEKQETRIEVIVRLLYELRERRSQLHHLIRAAVAAGELVEGGAIELEAERVN